MEENEQEIQDSMKIGNDRLNSYLKNSGFIWIFSVLLSFLIFGNSISNDFNIDDDLVLENNPLVMKGLKGIPEIFTTRYVIDEDQAYGYRPLAKASFAICYPILGMNPGLHRVVNILLYALMCVLIFKFLCVYFPKIHHTFWLILIALFAAHPLHTEVVVSLKNREEILSFIFAILALQSTLNYTLKRNWQHLLYMVIFLTLALLSKLNAVFLLVLIPVIFIQNSKQNIKLKSKLPHPRNLPRGGFVVFVITALAYLSFPFVLNPLINNLLISFMIIPAVLYTLVISIKARKFDYSFLVQPAFLAFTISYYSFVAAFGSDLQWFFYAAAGIIPLILLVKNIEVSTKINQLFLYFSTKIWIRQFLIFLILIALGASVYLVPEYLLQEDVVNLRPSYNPLFEPNTGVKDVLILAFFSLGFYIKMILIPFPLLFYYGAYHIDNPALINPYTLFGILISISFLVLVLKNRKNKFLVFNSIFGFAAIALFLNVVAPVPGIVAERLAFASTLPFLAILLFGIFKILKINLNNQIGHKALWLLVPVFLLYSFTSIKRNADWNNRSSLFSKDIKTASKSVRMNVLYADLLWQEAYTLLDKNENAQALEKFLQSKKHYTIASKLDAEDFNVWNNLGALHYNVFENDDSAKICFENSVRFNPESISLRYNLGRFYYNVNRTQSAKVQYKIILNKEWSHNEALMDLTDIYLKEMEYDSAIYINERAAKTNDEFGDLILAEIYLSSGNWPMAQAYCSEALKKNPNNKAAQELLQETIEYGELYD